MQLLTKEKHMARPKKVIEQTELNHELVVDEVSVSKGDQYIGSAKVAHLAVGVDLLGSKTSLVASRGAELEVYTFGVIAKSSKNNRKILIYSSNVKAVELLD